MGTQAINQVSPLTVCTVKDNHSQARVPWILTLPLLFLSCQGHFSFQLGDDAVGGALPGAVATRVPSLTGDLLIPGACYSIILFFMFRDRREIFAFARQFRSLTSLGIIAILSTFWSQSPLRSLGYGSFYAIGTFFAYWLVIHFETREIMTLIVRTGVIVCLLGLCLVIFWPDFGTAHDQRSAGAWRGIFGNRTGAAKVLVFLISPAFVAWGERIGMGQILYTLLLLLMLVKLHAVSSFLVLAVYLAVLGFLRFSRTVNRKTSMAFLLVGSAFSFLFSIAAYSYLPDILEAFGRDSTLTGRTLIWSALVDSIAKRPLLGYGFYSFWQGLTGESASVIHATHWTFGYAHNGYIEIVLQVGLIGGILFLLTLMSAIHNAWYCLRNGSLDQYDWYIGLVGITLVYNLDESTAFWPNDLTSILYIVLVCGLSQAARNLKQITPQEA